MVRVTALVSGSAIFFASETALLLVLSVNSRAAYFILRKIETYAALENRIYFFASNEEE